MSRTQSLILHDIEHFVPSPAGSWRGLDSLLDELWQTNVSSDCLPVLFRVFERFPSDDGAGVFWSILHGIESTDLAYEQALRDSLGRRSSELGQVMLYRLEKSQATE